MRILILSNFCPPLYLGGYEIACLNVAHALVARGHDVRLLTTASHVPGPPDPPFVDRRLAMQWFAPYSFHPMLHPGAARMAQHAAGCSEYGNTTALLRAIRDFAPEVVYCWNTLGIGGLALMDLLNTLGVPWVLHLMDVVPTVLQDGTPPHVRAVFNADAGGLYASCGLISMSRHILDMVAADTGIVFAQDVELIPGWVDIAALGPRAAYRRDGITRFVAAGTVSAHKGTGLIIEAAAGLAEAGQGGFTIDIYGEGEIAPFQSMAAERGLAERVRFHGGRRQAELLRLYGTCDAFLFPTHVREAFGFAPIEAAAAGCVPIMTRQCGAAERLVDGVHCLKIDRSAADLAAAMERVMRGEVDLPAMGQAGAALVAQDLSQVGCLDAIEAVLARHARLWDRGRLDDPKLQLLIHTKHHLARMMMLGIAD